MILHSNKKGVSIIAAIFIIVILAFMGVIFVTLIGTSSFTSVNDMQSAQALYVAEGGAEYILENRTYPNYSTGGATVNLGGGNFKVDTPTYLTADPGTVFPISVNSTTSFPATGRIVIDSELIDYTAKNATQFTAGTRGAGGTTAVGHSTANAAVYPVATVSDNPLTAVNPTIAVSSTVGFLIPGIIKIDEEYIYCTGTNAPATTQFTGCTRGYKGSTADSHPQNRNVLQYMVTSTGTVANAKRQVKRAAAGTGRNTFKGSFAKRGGAGAQSIAGVGFQPRAVIFYWTQQVAPLGFTADVSAGMGFATGPANQRAVSITTEDNSGSSDAGRRRSEADVIIFVANGGSVGLNMTLIAQAQLTSFDLDGFTLNWGPASDANAYIIHYIALGGDITDALASTFTFTSGGLGNNLSVAGIGFQPDMLMFLWSFRENVDTNTNHAQIGIGFAQNAAAQGAMVFAEQNNDNNNDAKRWQQRTTASILLLNPTNDPPNQYAIASLVSMDPNGFTINKVDPPANNTPIFYLALRGGRHMVGAFNQPAAAGNQTRTGVGFQAEQLMLASWNRVANNFPQAGGAVSIGAAQAPLTRGSIWFQDRSVIDPSEANMYTSTTDILTLATGPATVNARADFVSFTSDGFTLNWTAADATARQILYWAIGPNVARSGTNITPVNLDWREVYP